MEQPEFLRDVMIALAHTAGNATVKNLALKHKLTEKQVLTIIANIQKLRDKNALEAYLYLILVFLTKKNSVEVGIQESEIKTLENTNANQKHDINTILELCKTLLGEDDYNKIASSLRSKT